MPEASPLPGEPRAPCINSAPEANMATILLLLGSFVASLLAATLVLWGLARLLRIEKASFGRALATIVLLYLASVPVYLVFRLQSGPRSQAANIAMGVAELGTFALLL